MSDVRGAQMTHTNRHDWLKEAVADADRSRQRLHAAIAARGETPQLGDQLCLAADSSDELSWMIVAAHDSGAAFYLLPGSESRPVGSRDIDLEVAHTGTLLTVSPDFGIWVCPNYLSDATRLGFATNNELKAAIECIRYIPVQTEAELSVDCLDVDESLGYRDWRNQLALTRARLDQWLAMQHDQEQTALLDEAVPEGFPRATREFSVRHSDFAPVADSTGESAWGNLLAAESGGLVGQFLANLQHSLEVPESLLIPSRFPGQLVAIIAEDGLRLLYRSTGPSDKPPVIVAASRSGTASQVEWVADEDGTLHRSDSAIIDRTEAVTLQFPDGSKIALRP